MALSVAGALSRLSGEEPLSAAADQRDFDRLIVDYNRRQPQRPLTAAEGDLLRAVVVEFRDELSMLGYTVPAVAASAPHSPGMETPERVRPGQFVRGAGPPAAAGRPRGRCVRGRDTGPGRRGRRPRG